MSLIRSSFVVKPLYLLKEKKMRKFLTVRSAAVAAAVASFAGSASAAIETTGVTGALTEAGTAAAVVGGAVLVVIVGIKAFKYIRSAM
jgi:hypothetical protein